MKRLISLLAALCLLTALFCIDTGARALELERGQTAFREMEYHRPDVGALAEKAAELISALEGAESYDGAEELLSEFLEGYYDFQTMFNLAQIHYFLDMSVEESRQAYEECALSYGNVEQLYERVYAACAKKPYAEEFEDNFFWEGFAEEYDFSEKYSDAAVELMEREQELVSEYFELSTDPSVIIDGESVNLASYMWENSAYEAYLALFEYLGQCNEALGNIYIELVRLRAELAREMGYADVREMYADDYARHSTLHEEEEYLDSIAKNLRPLYIELTQQGASAELSCDEASLMAFLEEIAGGMGGSVSSAFEYMKEYGLYDLSCSINKYGNSFSTYLYDYEAPYLFLYPINDTRDYLSLAHEFGHFTQMYSDFDSKCSVDLGECFSQGMEALAACRYGILRDELLCEMLCTLVEQGAYADFENRVYSYEPEELSVELVNSLFLESAEKFGLTVFNNSEYCSKMWTGITHFYEYPYYILSYCLSADAALQLYELENARKGAGVEVYERLLKRDSADFTKAIEKAGLLSPFTKGRSEKNAEIIAQTLLKNYRYAS